MTRLVQVAVAGDVAEAELLQEALALAGIESQLEAPEGHDPGAMDDPPLRVLVPETRVEEARDTIESLSEADGDDVA